MSNRKRTYTDSEAISHILEWIENDKEEEGEDDLVELYGDEAEGRDSDDGDENSNNNGDGNHKCTQFIFTWEFKY